MNTSRRNIAETAFQGTINITNIQRSDCSKEAIAMVLVEYRRV